jgi:peptidoglycan/LPS O-acetylase OafA/YrhL
LAVTDELTRSEFCGTADLDTNDALRPASWENEVKNHFVFLDELRGMAALSVVLLHANQAFAFGLHFHAYLAVDFFFCLSGFVLAHGYDAKLKSGMLRNRTFLLKRTIRLYPMIAVGVALGVLAAQFTHASILSGLDVSILALGALLLLPLGLLVGQEAFAINNPLWSICFEIVAGVAYGSVAQRRIRLWHEIAALALLAAALFAVVSIEGTVGPVGFGSWRTFFEGLVRVGFSFLAGVLIFRWDISNRIRAVPPQVPLFLLIAVLFCPFAVARDIFDFVCIAIIFPIVLVLAVAVSSHEKRPFDAYLGQISYPLYIVHQPIMQLGAQLQISTGEVIPRPITAGLALLTAIAVAHLLYTRFDTPVRVYLGRKLLRPA